MWNKQKLQNILETDYGNSGNRLWLQHRHGQHAQQHKKEKGINHNPKNKTNTQIRKKNRNNKNKIQERII